MKRMLRFGIYCHKLLLAFDITINNYVFTKAGQSSEKQRRCFSLSINAIEYEDKLRSVLQQSGEMDL